MNSEELSSKIAAILAENKGEDISVYDVRETSSITDFHIAATGLSAPHLRALANAVRKTLKAEGAVGYKTSGDHDSGWMVLDYIDCIVHLFTREAREYYDLDALWGRKKAE